MPSDNIFAKEIDPIPSFEFSEEVVEVFNDMIQRSVPLYQEVIRRQAQLTAQFYLNGTRIYDLGCSNGNFGICLLREMREKPFGMIAVDNSFPMLAAYERRLQDASETKRIQLVQSNIESVSLKDASVVLLNLTLQFLPLKSRDNLLQKIHDAMKPGGILLLTEKVIHQEESLSRLQQDFYYAFKMENGYSRMEISQKREALENVLVPETVEEHLKRLRNSGFQKIDVWLKWFNFTSLLAVKD